MKRFMGVAALAVVVFVAVTAWAGVRATILLKSGDRITGDLVDLNASGLVLDTNTGQRALPVGDVAIIDFEGGADLPTARVGGGRLVLRGGQVVEGRLVDIGGTEPLRVTFDTKDGQRDYRSDEISRIYVADPPGQPTTIPGTVPPPGSITVRGDQVWTPTGVYVRRGQRVSFQSSGEVQLSGSENDVASVNGSRLGRYAQRSPLPMTLAGALIGRIGTGEPFGIGSQAQLTMPGDGQLFLGVNDDVVTDNRGEFNVTVLGGQARPRR